MRWLGRFILVMLTSAVSAYLAYYFTKSNYLAVGANNGSIQAQYDIIQQIDALLPNAKICSDSEYKNWKKIVEVKTVVIYFKQIGDTSVMVCISGLK